jgi:hypothetical protein
VDRPDGEAIYDCERPQHRSSASRLIIDVLLARGFVDPRDHALHVMQNLERRVSRRSRAELCTYVLQILTRLTGRGPNARFCRSPATSRPPGTRPTRRQIPDRA